MVRFFYCSVVLLLASLTATAQNFNGQWKGTFSADSSTEHDEYMLELQVSGKTQVTGFSYTYFDGPLGQRYFTICKVSGTITADGKSVTVTETEKVKGNIPPGIMDCLQTHTLTYVKDASGESLVGTWKPAPGFYGCGSGTTHLSKKLLVHTALPRSLHDSTKLAVKKTNPPPTMHVHHPTPPVATKKAASPPVVKAAPKKDTAALSAQSSPSLLVVPPSGGSALSLPPPQVRQRTNTLIQTIDIASPEVRIELYDDGIIDHDTVTVYFNGKPVVWKNMLSHKPIKVTLTALPDIDNDLILYADNLGDIPPNTALMIVYVGEDQYDVRVTSDEQTNGEVKFRLTKKK